MRTANQSDTAPANEKKTDGNLNADAADRQYPDLQIGDGAGNFGFEDLLLEGGLVRHQRGSLGTQDANCQS
jgi:hypothetical protein